MDHPFTIAHLSDLHISLDHSRQNVKKTRLLLEYCLRQGADHIVITGDITADGEKKELEAARKIFRNYGLLDSRKLSLVFGNHDLFGGVHRPEDILSFPKRCKTTHYDRKVKEFRECFHEVFDNSIHSEDGEWLPYLKVFGHAAIMGTNSIARYSRMRNPVGSNGEIDDGLFERMKKMLMSESLKGKRKIVLIHHHFNKYASDDANTSHSIWNAIERQTMKLRKKKRLLQLFAAAQVDIVLHGHVHKNSEYVRKGIRFLNAGASVLGDNSAFDVAFLDVRPTGVQTVLKYLPQLGRHLTARVASPEKQVETPLLISEAA